MHNSVITHVGPLRPTNSNNATQLLIADRLFDDEEITYESYNKYRLQFGSNTEKNTIKLLLRNYLIILKLSDINGDDMVPSSNQETQVSCIFQWMVRQRQ